MLKLAWELRGGPPIDQVNALAGDMLPDHVEVPALPSFGFERTLLLYAYRSLQAPRIVGDKPSLADGQCADDGLLASRTDRILKRFRFPLGKPSVLQVTLHVSPRVPEYA